MATGKPDSRETHVTRIFGTNKKGERLDDIWVDVERMDIVKSAMQVPPHLQWQGVQRKFRWADDPNADDYSPDGPPSRIVEIVKVCDPENTESVDDPEEWVKIPVIRALRARAETGTETNGGTAMERFLRSATADELRTARVVEVRKIAHCDTNVDDAIQAAADSNPTLRQYVVPSDVYVKDDATRDKDQYVDHEIITYLKHKGNAGDVAGIARQTKLLNEYLIDASDPAEGKVTGAFGFNPPYRLDPYQNIVNVSFGGLAVEFGAESLLNKGAGISDFKKAVISLWFRVPAASIAAVKAKYDSDSYPPPPLNGILPLIVFGKQGEQQDFTFITGSALEAYTIHHFVWNGSSYVEGVSTGPGTITTDSAETSGSPFAKNPSCIGVDCTFDQPRLYFNFETGVRPTVSGLRFATTGGTSTDFYDYNTFPGGPEPPDPPTQIEVLSVEDVSTVGYKTAAYGGTSPGAIIQADKWHHALLSVDLSTACHVAGVVSHGEFSPDTGWSYTPPANSSVGEGVSSAPKMWIAFDDVNLTRSNLATIWPTGYSGDNAIIASDSVGVAMSLNVGSSTSPIAYQYHGSDFNKESGTDITYSGMVAQSYSVDPTAIPASGFALGAPGSSAFSVRVEQVEMAELQIFTGVSLDTSLLANRRLFVRDDGKPELNYSKLKDVLGEPAVRLHRTGNWKKGRNTGTSGDFTSNGNIQRYRPDPSLRGPQG